MCTANPLAMVAGETALAVAVASVVGVALAGGMQAFATALINRRVLDAGAGLTVAPPWPVPATTVGLCLLLALVAAVVPARLAVRTRALDGAAVRG